LKPKPYGENPNAQVSEPGSSQKHRSQNVIGGRGSVRADGYLDHEYNERRELFGTLRVIAVSLAVLAVILFIALYLRQWMAT
jgi:xanthine/uracil permease